MGKILEQKIVRFDGGIADDPRQPLNNVGSLIKHFDVFSNPYKMSPYRSTETDTNDGSTETGMKQYDVRNFQLGLNGKLYGLGKTAAGYPKIVSKATPASGNWTLEATAEGNAARFVECFIEWQGAYWFLQGDSSIAKWVIATNTITNAVGNTASSIVTTAQGVIGSDNNLYIPYNNKIARISPAGAVTNNVFTAIPGDMRITSMCRYGSYIAIACAYGTTTTAIPFGRSLVVLWDMVQTTIASDVIDFGEGALKAIGNVEGMIVGISDNYLTSSTLALNKGSMVIRTWSGGIPKVFKEIVANQSTGRLLSEVVLKNNKMYWIASVPFNQSTSTESTYHLGIWVFGRKNSGSNFAISIDTIEENIDTANFKINSFGSAGGYWFINHSADGSITKTDDTTNYTFTSIYESQIFNNEDSSQVKKLIGVTVFTAPMPISGQIVLTYRKDEETSYTTVFTNTTNDSISYSAVNIESSGVNIPEYKEIQFRIESTGGAEITGFKFKYELISSDLY